MYTSSQNTSQYAKGSIITAGVKIITQNNFINKCM